MTTTSYVGYAVRVRLTNGVLSDARVNSFSPALTGLADLADYAKTAVFNGVRLASGKANEFFRIIPVSETEGLLMVLSPFAGKPGVRVDNIVDYTLQSENSVEAVELNQAPAPYQTKRYVRLPEGRMQHLAEEPYQNLLAMFTYGDVQEKNKVDSFAKQFGFSGGAAFLNQTRLGVPAEVVQFARWAGLFVEDATVTKLKPMRVTVRQNSPHILYV